MKTGYNSHKDDTHGGGEAPRKPHLALKCGNFGDPDSLLAIPPGATIYVIEDPRYAESQLCLILEKVEYENHVFKGLRFRVAHAGPGSTRRLYLTAAWRGEYKSALDADTKGVDAAMKELEDGK